MARRGDLVKCPCGELLQLFNDRLPWHKKPTGGNCSYSGVPAENWNAVPQAVADMAILEMLKKYKKVKCPKKGCGAVDEVRNAPEGANYALVCGACGTTGDLKDFAAEELAKPRPSPFGKHRY